uniref:V-set and transmembrane domain-containing protein 4 n=1 Tax=Oryctolagus cuniculus TaxID=9986 RepID=A0A5F9CXD8_RABIT
MKRHFSDHRGEQLPADGTTLSLTTPESTQESLGVCWPEVCGALNVTVSPGPVVDYLEGENATLLCHVSQKRRKDSLLAVRWFFGRADAKEALMVKMTKLRIVQYYGNFSRSANRQRLHLLEEKRGALYSLSVLTLRPADQGHYVCKVQEISKHRNKWTAWSNGSSATEMRVISLKASEGSSFEDKKETWAFFEDLYMYAVLVCCVGILSVLLFTVVILCQSLFSKRRSRVRHYLVKCPQNSSGETVTSVTSLAPLQPKKDKRRKEKVDVPPAVPAKGRKLACRFPLGSHQDRGRGGPGGRWGRWSPRQPGDPQLVLGHLPPTAQSPGWRGVGAHGPSIAVAGGRARFRRGFHTVFPLALKTAPCVAGAGEGCRYLRGPIKGRRTLMPLQMAAR